MTNPRTHFITVAERFLGIREEGHNRFTGNVSVWASTDYRDGWKNREPYCAAFMCHVVHVAGLERPELNLGDRRPRSASVRGWKSWARRPKNGVQILTKDPLPGDIVSFLPHLSHIGLVTSYDPKAGIVHTIEANTDAEGSREGDGIYRRERKLKLCGEFYRLPVKAAAV